MFQRRVRLAFAIGATIALGLVWRFAMPGLPGWAWKYGGSLLWGTMVYFIVAFALAASPRWRVATVAALVAVLVELLRLHHTPDLDAFRLTLAGKLLLGRVFSPWNIVAYWAGIAVGAAADRR